jgi:hypothetical protein
MITAQEVQTDYTTIRHNEMSRSIFLNEFINGLSLPFRETRSLVKYTYEPQC